jgi:hypothetical protein
MEAVKFLNLAVLRVLKSGCNGDMGGQRMAAFIWVGMTYIKLLLSQFSVNILIGILALVYFE